METVASGIVAVVAMGVYFFIPQENKEYLNRLTNHLGHRIALYAARSLVETTKTYIYLFENCKPQELGDNSYQAMNFYMIGDKGINHVIYPQDEQPQEPQPEQT